MNRKVLLIGLAVVVPMIAVLAMSLGRDPYSVRSPLVGRPAIGFTLPEVGSGRPLALADLQGKPVVINFWATWCVPCYAEHEVLTRVARMTQSQVQFIGVVYDDDPGKILQFLAERGSAYPTVVDQGGKVAIAYGVYGVPETFFVDRQGTIVAKHEGPLDEASLTNYVGTILGAAR